MILQKPINPNYCASVVQIKSVYNLEKLNKLNGTLIFGNQVLVSKEVKEGDIGIYFPVECQLSHEFVKTNNLYTDKDKNEDKTQSGYLKDNRRVKCVKFQENYSMGLFLPIECVSEFLEKGDKLTIETNLIS